MPFNDAILKLTKRLYPRGRAFRVPKGGVLEKAHIATAKTESAALADAISVLDGILPDNPNFTVEDARDWERRLGLITNENTLLTDRKAAIQRKMNHPGSIPARQHWLYLQRELQAANFDLYVYENRFLLPPTEESQMGITEMGVGEMGGYNGLEVYSVVAPEALLDSLSEMGVSEMGVSEMGGFAGGINQFGIVANYLENELDKDIFNIQQSTQMGQAEMGVDEMGDIFDYQIALRSTFYVMGPTFGTFGQVPGSRETELRQLILKVKPAQTVCFLFVELTGPDFNNDFSGDFLIP